ncbi:hypothetical protein G6F58_013702 [Rhizopus delemar]|nr:hypothetical protein G6F58_013702 [Rhizopus delemar]
MGSAWRGAVPFMGRVVSRVPSRRTKSSGEKDSTVRSPSWMKAPWATGLRAAMRRARRRGSARGWRRSGAHSLLRSCAAQAG